MIKETIQLQKQFPHHTLIVEVNHGGARMALGHGQQLDILSEVHAESSSEYSDNEGNNRGPDKNHTKDHEIHVLANKVIDKIKYLSGENKFIELKLYATKDYKKELESKLPDHIKQNTKIMIGNHGHDKLEDLA